MALEGSGSELLELTTFIFVRTGKTSCDFSVCIGLIGTGITPFQPRVVLTTTAVFLSFLAVGSHSPLNNIRVGDHTSTVYARVGLPSCNVHRHRDHIKKCIGLGNLTRNLV